MFRAPRVWLTLKLVVAFAFTIVPVASATLTLVVPEAATV